MDWLWAFVIIGGPIILGLALIYATVQYRNRGRELDRASQESAKRVREDIRHEDERASQPR
ncbi:hypothetical protein [Novosphingobium sp. M1R2S20]|uniref:Uncharacterized protein n=1 Tax=Novosphingobium rhizovicinum TaxID=3228928 RepID=A0ABV3R9T3_9SPHN